MSEDELSDDIDLLDISIVPNNDAQDSFERHWMTLQFAGLEEEENSRIIDLTNYSYGKEEEDNDIVGVDEKWESLGGLKPQEVKQQVMKIVEKDKNKALWKVIGMPNARPSMNHFIPPTGFAIGAASTNMKAPIPVSLIHPDKLGYGMIAFRVPYPEETRHSTEEFYNMKKDDVVEKIEKFEFQEDLKLEFNSSFVGVYEEMRDFGYYHRRALWIIIQDGDKNASTDFYDRIERSKIDRPIKTWKVLVEESAKMVSEASKRLEKQITEFMKYLGLDYAFLKEIGDSIEQFAHSFSCTPDGIYYVYYSGCFPVISKKQVILGVSPAKGFWLLTEENGEPWSTGQAYLHAYPYGTGANPECTETFPMPEFIKIIGQKGRAQSTRFRDRNLAFQAHEETVGRMKKQKNSLLVPYVVKLNEVNEEEEDCVWQ